MAATWFLLFPRPVVGEKVTDQQQVTRHLLCLGHNPFVPLDEPLLWRAVLVLLNAGTSGGSPARYYRAIADRPEEEQPGSKSRSC